MRANNGINHNISDKQPKTDDEDAEEPHGNKDPDTVALQTGHSVLRLVYDGSKYKI